MTMFEGAGRGSQAEQQVIERAAADPTFRAQLLENPRQALQQELGVSIPESTAIRVLEEQPGEVILVLPARQLQAGDELSNQDLEMAAGGTPNTYEYPTCSRFP